MPPRKGQMVTLATHRDSQELAKEAAERDVHKMDELPALRPQFQQNEEMPHDTTETATIQGAGISF